MANAKPNDRMEEHMPQPSIQVATQRLRQSLTWCKQWRDAHPKWFRAGLVACVLGVLYVSGWLLSLVRAVLWLLIMLAIGTAGLLWASHRWTWLVAVLEGRRWLLTRRPHVALVAAGMTSVALWSLPASRSAIAERESGPATAAATLEDFAGMSRSEPEATSTQVLPSQNVSVTMVVESDPVVPNEPPIAKPDTEKVVVEESVDKRQHSHENAAALKFPTLKGHTDQVWSVVFSPDGKRLASASSDHTVKVWDVISGQETLSLKGHSAEVVSVAFSPDGKRLASASYDKSVKVWDVPSGQIAFTLKGHTAAVQSVVFRPDGKQLASSSADLEQPGELKVWDAKSGQELRTVRGHTGGFRSVAFSPDGKRLASANLDETVRVWDATSGQQILTLRGHTGGVRSVSFSPDGRKLASASYDKSVKLWDTASGQEILTLKGHTGWANSVAFSPDGKQLASAGGGPSPTGEVKVWDATSGRETLTLKGHTKAAMSVAFSSSGMLLASASWDQSVKLWELPRSPELKQKVAQDGSVQNRVSVNAATAGLELLTFKGHTDGVWSVAFSPDGKRLASASYDRSVKVWDAISGREMLTLNGHTVLVSSVAFSPDGKRLASGSYDRSVKVWDAVSGQEKLTLRGHAKAVKSVAFSPDGKQMASASEDQTVKLWDTMNGHEMLALIGHSSVVESVAFSPDSKWLASSGYDNTIKVWDAVSGQEKLTLRGHAKAVKSVAFSPDGKQMASASEDQTVKLWDTATGQVLLTLKGQTYGVTSVTFSPDGKRLASAGYGKTIKVRDTTSGQEILSLTGHTGNVLSLSFSSDGKRLASASLDETVRVWNVMPVSQVDQRSVRDDSIKGESAKQLAVVEMLAPVVFKSWTVDQVKAQSEEARKGRYFAEPSLPEVTHLAWGGELLKEQVSFYKGRSSYQIVEMLVSLDAGRRELVKLRTQLGKSREFQPSEIIKKKSGQRVIEADSWDVEGYRVYAFVFSRDELNPVTGERPSYTYGHVVLDMIAVERIEKMNRQLP